MGVYIPNMEKPKHCTECYFVCRDQCELQDNSYDYDTFKEQKRHCPLQKIDLVRCGECKYMKKYALRSDEPTGIWCHRWSIPRLVTDDDFCSYGERRAE